MNRTTNPLAEFPAKTDLDTLAARLLQAKAAVKAAQQTVLSIEQDIIAAVGVEDEGSFTVRSDNFKVTTTQPVTRSVNKATVEAIRREMPEDLFQAMFDFKPSLNVKLFKECRELRPEVYALAAKAVTSKPGKVAVKVEEVSE